MIWRSLLKAVENAGWRKDSARIRRQSLRSARALKYMTDSGVHTRGGLADEKILEELGYFNRGKYALPVLSLNGRMLWDSGDRPVHVVGGPGTAKTVSLGLPMAATWPGSVLIIDVDHEYARATWKLRRAMGSRVVFVNPRGRYGFPSSRWNFFAPIVEAAQGGDIERAVSLARDAAFILVRERPDGLANDNEWVSVAAREILVMALLYFAKDRPGECTPANLCLFLMRPAGKVIETIGREASLAPVMRRLLKLQAEYSAGALKQVEWKIIKAYEPLTIFEPETPYARLTEASDFCPSMAKTAERPLVIYLCVEGDELESAGAFVSLFLSTAIERIASAEGSRRTLILADEFAQIPRAPGVIKALRAYRKRGLRIVTIAQTRHSVGDRYGETLRKDIEAMAGTTVWLAPSLEVAREIEAKSGTKTVLSHGAKDGDSGHVGKSLSETSAPTLHVSELCYVPEGKAILEIKGVPGPVLADRIPWWEIYPLSEEIDEAYRNDFYRYDGPP